jgi:flagellin-like hook-associated protein FlgL
LTQMKTLATQATSAGLTTSDTTSLNATFQNLASQVTALGTGASVNSNNLLSGVTGINVTTGIDGSASAQTNITGIDVPTIASTANSLNIIAGNSGTALVSTVHDNAVVSGTHAGVAATAGVSSTDTITISTTGFTTAASAQYTLDLGTNVGMITFTGVGSGTAATASEVAADIAAYIQTGVTGFATGTISVDVSAQTGNGGSASLLRAAYSASASGAVLTLTQKSGVGRTGTPTASNNNAIIGKDIATPATVTSTNTTAGVAYQAGTTAIDKVTFTALTSGQSITVGGLTFTAGSGNPQPSDIATAFYNFITNGTTPASTIGTFSGSTYANMRSLYSVGNTAGGTATPTGSYLFFNAVNSSGTQLAISTGSSVAAAQAAVTSLTTLLATVSTGQSTLAAAATGLTAQNSNANALKTGLTNTVNSIQNIDATAMQAKLQQLNNQQSIDYYLVSQMNTEAAAILSIFR